MIETTESFHALRMLPYTREAVDQAERALIESIMDHGYTWEQLGAVYGERSKQAMQQHYKRRGGERTWNTRASRQKSDVEAVRRAITGLLLSFRAADEALTRTMRDASWNDRDPQDEIKRRRSWVERLNDSMDELHDYLNNHMDRVPRWEMPLVVGDQTKIHDDHVEVAREDVGNMRVETERVLRRLQRHRDAIDATMEELHRSYQALG